MLLVKLFQPTYGRLRSCYACLILPPKEHRKATSTALPLYVKKSSIARGRSGSKRTSIFQQKVSYHDQIETCSSSIYPIYVKIYTLFSIKCISTIKTVEIKRISIKLQQRRTIRTQFGCYDLKHNTIFIAINASIHKYSSSALSHPSNTTQT